MDAHPTGILVVGNYCHDTLLASDGREHHVLGGSAAYIGSVLRALAIDFRVLAKVGADFRHVADAPAAPLVIESERTCAFVDDYRSGERHETCQARGPVITAAEVRGLGVRAKIAIACAVGGEVPAETLEALAQIADTVIADAQGILRLFKPDGGVSLQPLSQSGFSQSIARVQHLKASVDEARHLDRDVEGTLIVTDGSRGCTVSQGAASGRTSTHVEAFDAFERDATGAGDSFLAGYAIGLLRGHDPVRAARLGAFCGARAVEVVGVPRFSHEALAQLDSL
ncbi:MAG: carbohydrate kinase [Deltaproteobacteria bacterium]|nr:carbohydrate kinase [Deltaproteobacteria bacterium]